MTKILERVDVGIDFPVEDEAIGTKEYTFRLWAREGETVEVSINGSLWQPCRAAVGFWWYDWNGYLPGRHELRARVKNPDGTTQTTPSRNFRVESEPA